MRFETILKRSATVLATLLFAVVGHPLFAAASTTKSAVPAGDYVEARTASVFAGACHYSGEYMSDGREAIMAWHFSRGESQGVSISGLIALAVVRADDNLAEESGHHHTYLYIDSRANSLQQQALTAALEKRYASVFGDVSKVSATAISFTRTSTEDFTVSAPQIASLNIKALPDRACCKMPNLVWYKPLAPIENRRVGFTQLASCTQQTGGDAWSRGNENSAFYGTFHW